MRWQQKFGRSDLEHALSSNCGISDEQAQRCAAAVWDNISEALRRGALIQLRGVGVLSTRPSRKPGRRTVRFKVSDKLLEEADTYRPPADPEHLAEKSMLGIAEVVKRLTGARASRHLFETLLASAGYGQQRLLAALQGLARSGRFYAPEDLRGLVADVVDIIAMPGVDR